MDAKTYVFKWLRRLAYLFAAEGICPSDQWADPLKVQAVGTPEMSVNVLGGDSMVKGDFTADYGMILYNNDATVNLEIDDAHPTQGRIDIVIVQLYDNSDPALEVVTGVPSGSPAVPATPSSAYKLAEIAVAAGVTVITNANITDRRAITAFGKPGGWLTADIGLLQITNALMASGIIRANDYICVSDEKAQSISGGTFTAGAWRTRDINQKKADTGGHCSIAANQITLAAGTYIFSANVPAISVDGHQARLQNITDGVTVLIGGSAYSFPAGAAQTDSVIKGRFTIAAQKTFEIQHYCATTKATIGFGVAGNFATEVYTIATFFRQN